MKTAPVTVVEFGSFERTAKAAGLSEEERAGLTDFIARNPEAGDLIQGTGGVRKLRWAGKGKGKSGAYRAIYYSFSVDFPIFLLAIYTKAMKEDLSSAEKKAMTELTAALKAQAKTTISKRNRS